MGINLVYERTNQDVYDLLVAGMEMQTADDIGELISNTIFPTILNKIGDTIIRSDITDRNYSKFKLPLSEFGAITEYLASNMIKASNSSPTATGSKIDDFVVNNPDIKALYSTVLARANYPLTINSERYLDMVDNRDLKGLSSIVAIAMQSLYDGITHDHDSMIPALLGALYTKSPDSAKRILPKYDGNNKEEYSKSIYALLNKGIRDLTQWRRTDFNIMGMEMSDSKNDLVLVSFENPVAENEGTILDIITSQINIGATARATALGNSLGLDVYEMPSMGIISNSVARAYTLPNFPGMQTADMSKGVQTPPFPKVKFALVGKGAINVGLKRLQNDTGRSIRGHFDQTWVQPTLQLAYGAGQAIFFSEEESEIEP